MTPRTFYEAVTWSWSIPQRRLQRIERRFRRRQERLDAEELARWAAVRKVLRARGVALPRSEDRRAR